MTRNHQGDAGMPDNMELERLIGLFRLELAAIDTDAANRRDGLGIDELMRRVDAALGGTGDSADGAPHAFPTWSPVLRDLEMRGSYALSELLQFDDARFVEMAYRVVLRRMPDPTGNAHYLESLRRGALSKVGVLAALRWSPEGVSRGVHVDGLLLPHLLERCGKWPVVGPLLGWTRSFLRLHTLPIKLEGIRQVQARELQALGASHNVLARMLAGAEREAEASRGEARARIDDLAADSANARRALSAEIEQLRSRLQEALAEQAAAVSAIRSRFEAQAAAERGRLEREESVRSTMDSLYLDLEDRFRGEQVIIRARVERYLDLVRKPGVGTVDAPVIDVGSGRGEWLDVLRHAGMHAFGIDANPVLAANCQARGLAVTVGDAVATLASLPQGSAGAVTAMHVVEHLPFAMLVELIDQSRRVLKPGGLLLLETPNPENVNVGSNWFYMDPTHRNPIPPPLLQWLVQQRGFSGAEVLRLSDNREFVMPDLVQGDVPGAEQINSMLAGYRAAPDYAVVAWRG